jgi:uncharacterized protein (TIGR02271 family)
MSGTAQSFDIGIGDDVYGTDGDKVGTVSEVQANYLVVEKGFFFPTDYYIPASAVSSASNGQVMLNVDKDTALHSGWDTVPETTMTTSGSSGIATDLGVRPGDAATSSVGSTMRETIGTQPAMAGYEATAEDELRIPVMEEELTATVRPQEAGSVRIEKDVVAEERTLDVPVTEERVRVERRIVDRPATTADATAFQEIVVDVPVMREAVDVQKEARVAEEVVVSKEAVQRTEQVRGTVRREEVTVDEGGVVETDLEGTESGSLRST